jgi:hypothetical protein
VGTLAKQPSQQELGRYLMKTDEMVAMMDFAEHARYDALVDHRNETEKRIISLELTDETLTEALRWHNMNQPDEDSRVENALGSWNRRQRELKAQIDDNARALGNLRLSLRGQDEGIAELLQRVTNRVRVMTHEERQAAMIAKAVLEALRSEGALV